jgi:Pectate lyase superfamily protein
MWSRLLQWIYYNSSSCEFDCSINVHERLICCVEVYVPPGTYLVTRPIVDFYYTQLIGNPNCIPVIKADPSFTASYIIDGDPYLGGPNKAWLYVVELFLRF